MSPVDKPKSVSFALARFSDEGLCQLLKVRCLQSRISLKLLVDFFKTLLVP